MKKIILCFISVFLSFTMKGQYVCGNVDKGTYYTTLNAAFADADSWDRIELLANITQTDPVVIPGNKSIYLNLTNANKNTYSLTINTSATPGSTALRTGGNLQINGPGHFTATGADVGIELTGSGSQALTVAANVNVYTASTETNTVGIKSAAANTVILGSGILNVTTSGPNGDGMQLNASGANLEVTGAHYSGIIFNVRGAGAGHGLNLTGNSAHVIDISINWYNIGIFIGGENGNGLNSPGSLTVTNTNPGDLRFMGGSSSGNGIYTNGSLNMSTASETLARGGGTGCGIKIDNTDITLSFGAGVKVSGGDAVPSAPGESAGLWLKGNTTIYAGNVSFKPLGNNNGGPGIYVDADGATLTLYNNSYSAFPRWIEAIGGANSYGIYAAGALTLAQSGYDHVNLRAQGGAGNAGVYIAGGKDLTLSGDLTVESIGGNGAKSMALSASGKVNFTDAKQTLIVRNNSASVETFPCHKSTLVWTVTDDGEDIPINGNVGDNDIYCIIPEASGGEKSATIQLTDGKPVITTPAGALQTGMVSMPYSQKIKAINYPTSRTVTSGSLPLGLSINSSTGMITGEPTAVNNYNFTVTASNGYGTSAASSAAYNIDVEAYIQIVPVTDITDVPTRVGVYKTLTLKGTVHPLEATKKDIIWTIKSDGGTDSYIWDNWDNTYGLTSMLEGEVVVTATILNGLDYGVNFTKDFIITVYDGVICEIVGGERYTYLIDAINSTPSNEPVVIRLLDHIVIDGNYDRMGYHYEKIIIFDLNGYDLTVTDGESFGIALQDSYLDYTGQGRFIGKTEGGGSNVGLALNGNSTCKMTEIEVCRQGTSGLSSYSGESNFYTGNIILSADGTYGIMIENYSDADLSMTGNITGNIENAENPSYGVYVEPYEQSSVVIDGNISISGDHVVGVYASGNETEVRIGGDINIPDGTGVSVYNGAIVIVEGEITASEFIHINDVPFTAGNNPSLSKPGYDEYTDGVSYVYVKTNVEPAGEVAWTGESDENWNNPANWNPAGVPLFSNIVTIPFIDNGSYFYPVLDEEVTVAEIHFEPGARIGNQHFLNAKAFVQYDLSERGRWHMLSVPLGQAYAGDFTFGGNPTTWLRTFEVRQSSGGSLTRGLWVTARGREKPFTFGDGFVLWVDAGNPNDVLVTEQNNIHEIPFFANPSVMSHPNHEYASGTSTFRNPDNWNESYTVGRSNLAPYQLLKTGGLNKSYYKPFNFATNSQVGGDPVALVGNPFMANLSICSLHEMNNGIKPGYHVWTRNGYKSYQIEGNFGIIDINNPAGDMLAPLQSFLVEKSDYWYTCGLLFQVWMTDVNNKNVVLRSSIVKENKLDIVASNPAAKVLTYIANREGGQDTFGDLDSRKIINDFSAVPEVYTLKPHKNGKIATGANIINTDDILIPVGLATSYTGKITLSFSGMDTYNAQLNLIDSETGRSIDLTGLASYDYIVDYTPKKTGNETIPCEDRFFIRISKAVTGLTETVAEKVNVFQSNESIHIFSGASNPIKEVAVYNLQGALLYKEATKNAISHTINRSLPAGVYVVRVVSEKSVDGVRVIKR